MHINKLKLQNFRNYEQEEIPFFDGQNLFISQNGQGKTNLLEALFFVMTFKSIHRVQHPAMIGWGKDSACLELEFTQNFSAKEEENKSESTNHSLRAILTPNGKTLWVNEKKIQKTSQLLDYFFPLFYSSDYVFQFKTQHEERRRLIDRCLGSLQKGYYTTLKEHNQILNQKNFLLKQGAQAKEILSWNQLLASRIRELTLTRKKYISLTNENLAKAYRKYSGTENHLSFFYTSKFSTPSKKKNLLQPENAQPEKVFEKNETEEVENFSENPSGVWTVDEIFSFLEGKIEQEKRVKYSLYGSHLDRYRMNQQQVDLEVHGQDYFSEGQFCLAYYCLLLQIQEIYHHQTRKRAIFLIDDLFQGVDQDKKQRLVTDFSTLAQQGFLTSHESREYLRSVHPEIQKKTKIFFIHSGRINTLDSF